MLTLGDVYPLFRAAFFRLNELERRQSSNGLRGPVRHVDAEKGVARIVLGYDEDGVEVLGPWQQYQQIAGGLKAHIPPTENQIMAITAENGDLEQGTLKPSSWSDDNAAPSQAGDVNKFTFGDVVIELRSDGIFITIGGTATKLASAGFDQQGGRIKHNDKHIDDAHVHDGVMPGGGQSDVPAN